MKTEKQPEANGQTITLRYWGKTHVLNQEQLAELIECAYRHEDYEPESK